MAHEPGAGHERALDRHVGESTPASRRRPLAAPAGGRGQPAAGSPVIDARRRSAAEYGSRRCSATARSVDSVTCPDAAPWNRSRRRSETIAHTCASARARRAASARPARPAAPVSYTHLRAHETVLDLVCRLLLEK